MTTHRVADGDADGTGSCRSLAPDGAGLVGGGDVVVGYFRWACLGGTEVILPVSVRPKDEGGAPSQRHTL